jgi:hypothetical protein
VGPIVSPQIARLQHCPAHASSREWLACRHSQSRIGDGAVQQGHHQTANVDVGSLVQGNANTGTFMFEVMQRDVIRVFVYVPQDVAFGVAPRVDAIVRVPEIPNREFPGKVTRIADALQSGTRTLLTEIDIPNSDDALQPRGLLHRRTQDSTPDTVLRRARRSDHLQSQ